MTTSRIFRTTTAVAGSFILPRNFLTRTPAPTFFSIHADSCIPIPDPVLWSLEHAHEPVLARAAEGLGHQTMPTGPSGWSSADAP